MARLDWLQLCETAFLDTCDRLCIIGMMNRLPVPAVPIAIHQLMLAARVADVRPGEELDVGLSITTPAGLSPSPDDPQCIEIAIAGEYVLITVRQFPLVEEGLYRFAVTLGGNAPIAIDIPVLVMSKSTHAQVH
jgi:uncharacterized protein DUF6941